MNYTEMMLNYWAVHLERFTVASQASSVSGFRTYGAQPIRAANALKPHMRCKQTRQPQRPEMLIPPADWSRIDNIVSALQNEPKKPYRDAIFNHFVYRWPKKYFCSVYSINYRTYQKVLSDGIEMVHKQLRSSQKAKF